MLRYIRGLLGFGAMAFAIVLAHALGGPQRIAAAQAGQPAMTLPADYFEARVRPILAANCYDCHTDDEKGGLRLDSRDALVKGGENGPAIVPGDPDASLLIQAVRQLPGKPKMPKGGGRRLTADEIAVLSDWIKAGAPWPATSAAKP